MTNKELEKLINKIENFIKENEFEILEFVAEKINLPQHEMSKDPKKLHENILDRERKGLTGFDCGWSYVGDKDPKQIQLIEYINNRLIKDESDYIQSMTYWNFLGNPEPSITFTLHKYELNVQSTTIKDAVNRYVIDGMNLKDFYTFHKLD